MMKKLSIGILAHVDAGKTTLSEALLYQAGKLKKLGRVDHKDSYLDTHILERERGITIFSKQARFCWNDLDITLLDTPGHVDFSAEMERTLCVLDYAVLVISGTDGVQAHTETLWNLLHRYQIPTFLFITKMDVANLSRFQLMEDLQQHLSPACIDFTDDIAQQDRETVALLDDSLFERYLSDGVLPSDGVAEQIQKRRLFPCFFGSGLKLDGIEAFLHALELYTTICPASDIFGARVFKIARDTQGKRLTFVKITGGSLCVRSSIRYLSPAVRQVLEEKVSEIRFYSGQKYETCDHAEAGDICCLLGLSGTGPGQGLGAETDLGTPLLQPALCYCIGLPVGIDARSFLPMLRQLEEEDPQLHVVWNDEKNEIQIQLMGVIQTEVLRRLVKDRFDIDITIGTGSILYKETILDCVEGIGHYEPLRHYAEVHLQMEPGEPGSGIVIDTACPEDDLELHWQRLILTHLQERPIRGVLTGGPVTDIKITLLAGRAHPKHTEGGDFRQATYRAVRQGLMQAKSVLLEPVYDFRLEVPAEQIGRAITDIHAMDGEFSSPEALGDRMVLTGTAPVAAMKDYITQVLAYTGGRGRLSCHMGGYRPCKDAASVLAAHPYRPEADPENTPDSVFCAHGAGFPVKWDEVSSYCHIPPLLTASRKEDSAVSSPHFRRSTDLDEQELEAIMLREFGPIHRKQYASPTVNGKAVSSSVLPKKQRLIIDGYNVIFGWEELKALSHGHLDAAREQLLDLLQNYQGFTKTEIVVVFDAYRVPGGGGEKEDRNGLHIVYTKENESADMYIERLADEIGKNENVRVVTSDALIQLTALRSGVLRTSTREFKEEVSLVMEQIRTILLQSQERAQYGKK